MHTHFLTGEKIYLRPYLEDDARTIHEWHNDPEVTYYMFTGQRPTTAEQSKQIIEGDVHSYHNTVFMVCDKEKDILIGLVGLYEIHETTRKAEMRIIIGNKEYWGKGYGTEVTELITFYGFDRLNLNRIYLGVTDENKGGVRAYEKAGYVHEGVLREDIYRNSRYYDSVRMGILRKEYYEKFYEDHKKRFAVKK